MSAKDEGGVQGASNQNQKSNSKSKISQQKGPKKNASDVIPTVLKNYQKELQDQINEGLPTDPEVLKQIFTKQQMLLELQTEMMSQLVKTNTNESATSTTASQESKKAAASMPFPMPNKRYSNQYGFHGFDVPGQSRRGLGGRRFNQHGAPLMRNQDCSAGYYDYDDCHVDEYQMYGARGYDPRQYGYESRHGFGYGPREMRGGDGYGPFSGGYGGYGPSMAMGRGGYGSSACQGAYGGAYGSYEQSLGKGSRDMVRERRYPSKGQKKQGLVEFFMSDLINRPYGSSLPTEDRLTILKREVFKYEDFPQAMTVIETSRHNCQDAMIRTIYEDEALADDRFRGFLIINGILIAVEEGRNKVEAKAFSYSQALRLLITKPISFLYSNSQQLFNDHIHPTKKKTENSMNKERLHWILESLHHGVHSLYKSSVNRDFEEIVYELELGITHIYRQTEKGYSCELYIDDLFIAQKDSPRKKDAYQDALKLAREKLFLSPSRNRGLLNKALRLTNVNFADENIIDVQFSENRHRVYSNLEELKKKGVSTKSLEEVKDDLVIILPLGRASAWNCLQQTALANNIFMEFVENNRGNCKRCIIYIQGKCIADSNSNKDGSAKNVAMERAKTVLLRKYDTSVEIAQMDYEKVTLTFDEVKEKADELKKSEPKLLEGVNPQEHLAAKDDPEPDEMSPWIDAVLRNLIEQYTKTEGLEEMVISDLPSYHSQLLVNQADTMEVIVQLTRRKNVAYTTIQKAITKDLCSKEFIDYVMSSKDSSSGRYKVVKRETSTPQVEPLNN
ncbi:uncharacterized protein LOC126827495 [Patella vulgata]|uniref:uncharacterized protein LOC126827495 n=1 Tax=Patella vulgata TaxID=6465 RepID=UPI00217F51A6|nr:uncharacterized protein LOC126827495 [Patella vulgata]XP_050412855.1 uncharacterized protein LOC126827495 [Patella vulgata]